MTSTAEDDAHVALQCYTLEHGGKEFIHQHVVDAWMAQHADEQTKPIGLTFALVGLYLHLEAGFTGRQVQLAHMALARHRRPWPSFPLPADRGALTAIDVMRVPEGVERDRAIDAWCASVWASYANVRQDVADLLRQHGIIGRDDRKRPH
jgi:hypothetical protein